MTGFLKIWLKIFYDHRVSSYGVIWEKMIFRENTGFLITGLLYGLVRSKSEYAAKSYKLALKINLGLKIDLITWVLD